MSSGKVAKGNKELYAAMQEKFPKFNKISLCMINNPEYGVTFTSEALEHLGNKNIPLENKRRSQTVKPTEFRNKSHRLTVRLNDDDYEKFKKAFKTSGCTTTQEYLERLVKEAIADV